MIPVVANVTASTPAPPSLVTTSLAENFAQHVPPANVSPSVSSVQISNNARGNGSYTPIDQIAQYSVPVVEGDAATGTAGNISSTKIPATFLAQMIGQDVPPALQGALSNVLASYDQLVANSFVKYKPSNATVPPPPPTGVFGRFLAQEHVAPPQPVRAQPEPVRVEQLQSVRAQQPQEISVEQVARAAAPEIKQTAPVEKPAPLPQPKRAGPTSVKVAIAYLMAEARVDLEAAPALNASA
jgi:hypothetical protein